MDDLISRSDAIGAVKEERFPIDSDYAEGFMAALDKVEWILKEWLPSAQPETHEERTETHSCDLISRQAAIDAVSQALKRTFVEYEDIARTIIGKLPSAQPERQKGEWIDCTEDGYVECPFCHSATNCDGNKDELHFCFSCGADMREPEDIPMEYFESGGR